MRRLRPFILIIVILAAWETAARSGLWSPLLFPSLERIGHEFWLFVSRPEGWWQTWTSLYRAFGGFALAALAGVAAFAVVRLMTARLRSLAQPSASSCNRVL